MEERRLCRFALILLILLSSLITGCEEEEPDQRTVGGALESTARQAEQNRQMAELQQQVAEGTKQLVQADAQARRELAELQRALRSDQAEIGRQRDALEAERQRIAEQRYWDSVVGQAIGAAAGILACLSPLLLAGWILYVYAIRDRHAGDAALADLLVEELTTERPLLLAPPQSVRLLEDQRAGTPEGVPPGEPSE